MVKHAWYKLSVATNDPLNKFDDPLLRENVGKSLVDAKPAAHAQQMAFFYDRILGHQLDRVKNLTGGAASTKVPITLVITLPENWSEKHRGLVKSALERSNIVRGNINRLKMMSEAEAAAIAAIAEFDGHGKNANPFKVLASSVCA